MSAFVAPPPLPGDSSAWILVYICHPARFVCPRLRLLPPPALLAKPSYFVPCLRHRLAAATASIASTVPLSSCPPSLLFVRCRAKGNKRGCDTKTELMVCTFSYFSIEPFMEFHGTVPWRSMKHSMEIRETTMGFHEISME